MGPVLSVVGDSVEESFETFVASRLDRLVGLAVLVTRNISDAEDAVQDALASVYARWRRLPEGGERDRYVNRVVVNACLKRLRGRTRQLVVADLDWVPDAGGTDDPVADAVMARQAWRLCAELPGTQRAAVVLRFYEGLSFAEIADILGCRETTARSHVHRAISALRASYQKDECDG